MNTEKRPRGWNLRKGSKDALNTEVAKERGKVGGKIGGLAKVPKGFASAEVQAKAQETKKSKAELDT